MAVINSLAIGKSVKSAGNLTYKTVRGRTIASQRITQNKSNTLLQQLQRGHFSTVSKCVTLCQAWIDRCFEKSKYGSARNQFFKLNPDFTLGNLYSNIIAGNTPFAQGFLSCFANFSESAKLSLSYVGYGSAACVVTEDLETIASVNVSGGSTLNNVRASNSYSVAVPAGIDYQKLKFVFVLFPSSSPYNMTVEEISMKLNESNKVVFDWESANNSKAEAIFDTDSTFTATDGVVSSFSINCDFSGIEPGTTFFLVPILAGKPAKITAPMVWQQGV